MCRDKIREDGCEAVEFYLPNLVDKWLLLLRKLFIVLESVEGWRTSSACLLHHVLTSNWDVTVPVTGAQEIVLNLRGEAGQTNSLKLIENFKSFLTRSQNFQKIKNCVFFPTLSFKRKIGRLLTKIIWSLAFYTGKINSKNSIQIERTYSNIILSFIWGCNKIL